MSNFKILTISISTIILLGICVSKSISQKNEDEKVSNQLGYGYDFEGNGKDLNAPKQVKIYEAWVKPDQFEAAFKSDLENTIKSLEIQEQFLKSRSRNHNYGQFSFDDEVLKRTIQKLLTVIAENGGSDQLQFYRITGEDTYGNVHFTAYYTPLLEARRKMDSIFKYPIYKRPDSWTGSRPTRIMIDQERVLADRNLEIAWTSSLLDNYLLQVQGSGYLQFEDGSTALLLFEGQNGHPYTSIGRYMVNQGYIDASEISLPSIRKWFSQNPDSTHQILNRNESYTFFKVSDGKIIGATNTELVPGHSIAVDPKYIPYGAVLLALVPMLDSSGNLVKHEYRLLTAQDRGGAIKGPGHVDLYEGIGKMAEQRAGGLHHYGKLWLILSK